MCPLIWSRSQTTPRTMILLGCDWCVDKVAAAAQRCRTRWIADEKVWENLPKLKSAHVWKTVSDSNEASLLLNTLGRTPAQKKRLKPPPPPLYMNVSFFLRSLFSHFNSRFGEEGGHRGTWAQYSHIYMIA